MSANGSPSPAPRWARTLIALGYVLVWVVVQLINWIKPGDPIPIWYDASGLVVLGYLLGINLDHLLDRGGH